MRKLLSGVLALIASSVVVVAVAPSSTVFAAPTPAVTVSSDQLNPLIGEQVTLTVAFDNLGTVAADTGYGPYVDLRFNSAGADGNDGMTFSSASYIGAAIAPRATFNCTGAAVIHPLTGVSTACPTGTQIVVIQLPFGSFTPGQPVAPIQVTAVISNLADVGSPVLLVSATPGFAYGNSPTGSTPIGGPLQSITFTPQVLRFTKTYVGPEHETATGPNYPRRFRLSVDIATGQRVNDLTLTDRLPAEYAFLQVNAESSATAAFATPPIGVPSDSPTNQLVRVFPGVTTGTGTAEEAFIEFEYFIPLDNTTPATIIDPSSGDDVVSRNDGQAAGTVDPLDSRDSDQPFTVNPNTLAAPHPDDVEMTAKSIAVQKTVITVAEAGDIGPTPGDTLEYTISGQVSDYFTFAGVVVNDVLGDGQTFDTSYTPVLSLTELGTASVASLTSHFGVDESQRTVCGNGTTGIQFDVSAAYTAAGGDGAGGILTGGRVNAGNTGPATFTIKFRAVINDAYICSPGPDNKLDPRDFVTNGVTVTGEVYDNATQLPQASPLFETDNSGTQLDIMPTTIQKSIWARNGVVGGASGSPAEFAANDTITYRILMHLPSSDISGLTISDYLPLPILTATVLTQGPNCTAVTAPALGEWCYGPADTFHDEFATPPTVTADAVANSITWTYGTRESTDNAPRDIELMFSVQISDDPFREGLFLTNQIQAFESNSFASPYSTPAIVQIELTEPLLNIDKGVVATSTQSPAATFTGTRNPTGVTFNAVGTAACPSFAPAPINSTNTATGAPAANVSGLDAADLVRFAIVVENTGTGLNGAYDLTISDAIPAGFRIPAGGLDLCVTNGGGTALAHTSTGFFTGTPSTDPLGTGTITLTDGVSAGALAAYHATGGANLAVISYDLELVPTIGANTAAASLTNTATIANYAATEGGPSFVPITPVADITDTATVATKPLAIAKQLVTTNQTTTTGTNVAIGEEAQYTVTVTFPEGLSRNVTIIDTLPAGLAISQAPVAATVGSALSAPGIGAPVVSNGGHTLTYTVGNVTNSDTTNATTTNETIAFTFWAVVLDVAGNQNATTLTNSGAVSYERGNTGSTISTHTATTPVVVVEPNLNVAKSASSPTADAADPLTYTIVVNHNAPTANAHDVSFSDTIPVGVTYVGNLASSGTPPTTLGISGNLITATWTPFAIGSSTTITFDVQVDANYDAITPIQNTASIAWTSLPGSPTATLYDAAGVERTGAGGVNDYVDSGAVTVQPIAPTIVKALVATDQATTTSPNVTIGEVVTYDLLVTLPDGNITGGLTVTDELPNGLQYVDTSVEIFTVAGAESPSAGLAAPFGGTLGAPVTTGGGGSGTDVVVTFGPTVNPADGNATNNSFVVRLRARVLDVPGNVGFTPGQVALANRAVVQLTGSSAVNSAFVSTPVVEPRIVITKSFTPTTASQGDTVTVNLAVQNTGLAVAHEVIITDVLDSHFDETAALEGTTAAGFAYSRSTNTITYTGGSIAAGDTVNFSFTVPLDAVVPIGTAIPNTATAIQATTLPGSVSGERDEPDSSSNAILNSVGPDLQLTKSDAPTTSVAPGATTTYNLVVTNVGGFQATGVYIDDTLPAATTFAGVGGAGCSDGGVVGSARRILVAGPIAPAGGSVTCTITITMVSPAPAGTAGYLNTAVTADDGQNGPDPTPANNTATDNNTITGRAPNLVVTKDDGQTTLTPGQSTTYTITVANVGNIGVTNVNASDTLPAGLAFTSCAPVTGSVNVACSHNSGIVTIGFSSIAGGGSASFTITAQVDDPIAEAIGSVNNIVSVTDDGANGSDANPADNTDADNDTIDATPDLAVSKSHIEPNVGPGGTVNYQLLVSNNGDQNATGVTVTDTIDPQMTVNCGSIAPPATSCNPATGVIVWGPGLRDTGTGVGTFVAGQTRQLTYTATADNPLIAGTVAFTNDVTVADDASNGTDPTPADNADSDVVPLTANAPELSLTKTDGIGAVVPADTPTYTLVVTNSGNIGASGVTITDTLPADLEFVSCTASCNTAALPVVTWNVGGVAGGGGQATVTVTVRVKDPAAPGITQITNPASVADDGTNGADPLPANNWASDTDTLAAAPDLVVTKDDGATSRNAGEQFDYTITVSNVGDQAATGVMVVDTLPDELTALSCPATPTPCTIGTGLAAGTVTWNLGNLNGGAALPMPPANSSVVLTVTVQVDSTLAAGIVGFTNTVRADDDATNGADPTPLDNQASDTDALAAVPDLQITKTDGRTTVEPGDTPTYQIVVTNAGSQATTGVTVTDTLPPGVTFVSCTPTCDSSALPTVQWTGVTEDVTGSPPDPTAFDALGQATLTLVVTVDSPALAGIDDLDNFVVVADDGLNGIDPTPTDNSARDLDVLDAAPDLAVVKSDGVLAVVGGQTVIYDVEFRNEGNQDATGVVVTDLLPAGVTFLSCSDGCVSSGEPTIVWTVGDLAAGQSFTYQLTATVDDPVSPSARHFVNNVSIVDDGSNGADPDPADNSDADDDTTGIDLSVTKTDGQTSVVPGSAISYTIRVTNNGPTTIQSFELRDTVPASLQGVVFTPSVGTYDSTSRVWDAFGDFDEAETLSLTVTGTVNPAATGTLTNTVEVRPPATVPETDPADNTASDIDELAPTPTLIIDKQLLNALVRGTTAVYSLSVRNDGPSVATGVTMTDALPSSLTYVGVVGTGWSCSPPPAQQVVCNLSTPLQVNETRSVELTVTVVGDFGSNVVNQATVSSLNAVGPGSVLSDQAAGDIATAPPPNPDSTPLPSTGSSSLRSTLCASAGLVLLGLLLVLAVRIRRRVPIDPVCS